jgi:hypothetical protein
METKEEKLALHVAGTGRMRKAHNFFGNFGNEETTWETWTETSLLSQDGP